MSSVAQILDTVADSKKPATKEQPKFEAVWKPLTLLVLRDKETQEVVLRIQITASNHHQRRFSWQFVNAEGRSFRHDTRFDVSGTEVNLVQTGFDGAIFLINEARAFIEREMKADALKNAEYFNRKNSASPKPGGNKPNSGPPAVRAMGKTAKKREKEANRKAAGGAS